MTLPPPTANDRSDGDLPEKPSLSKRPPIPPPVQTNDSPPPPPPELIAPPVQAPVTVTPSVTSEPAAASPRIDHDHSVANQQNERRASRKLSLPTICCIGAILAGGGFIAIHHMSDDEQPEVATPEPTLPEDPQPVEFDPEEFDYSSPNASLEPIADSNQSPTEITEEDVPSEEDKPSPKDKTSPNSQADTSPKPDEKPDPNPKPAPKKEEPPTDPKSNPLAYVKLVRDAHKQCKNYGWDTGKPAGYKAFQTLLRYSSEVMALQQDHETEEGLRVIAMGPVTDALADLKNCKWPANAQIERLNRSALKQGISEGQPVFAYTQVVRSTKGIALVDGQPALLLEVIGTGQLVVYPVVEHRLVKKGTKFLVFGVQQPEGVKLPISGFASQQALLVRGEYLLEQAGKTLANNSRTTPAFRKKPTKPKRKSFPVRRN